jgi:hypothetical protein
MSLTVNAGNGGGKDFAPVSEGVHIARCYQIVDLGHQTTEYQGQVKVLPKVRITWEICDEQMTDGRPFSISKEYTASIGVKATLRKDLEAWRNRKFTEAELAAFSLENVLNAPCQLQIGHTQKGDKTYASVNSIMAIAKGTPVPELVNPAVKFDIQEFDHDIFNSLTSYVQKKILLSKELEESGIPEQKEVKQSIEVEDDESVPF